MLKNPIVLLAIVLLIFFMFLPSFSRMQDLKKKNLDFQEQLRQLASQNADLLEEKKKLIEDPAYLEKVAREKMGLAREGEVILRMMPDNTTE